jgi:hypothetical protein
MDSSLYVEMNLILQRVLITWTKLLWNSTTYYKKENFERSPAIARYLRNLCGFVVIGIICTPEAGDLVIIVVKLGIFVACVTPTNPCEAFPVFVLAVGLMRDLWEYKVFLTVVAAGAVDVGLLKPVEVLGSVTVFVRVRW